MTAVWQSGHTYVPGSLVKPLTTPPPGPVQIVNGTFETGSLSGWTQSLGAWSISTTSPYAGANCAITSTSGGGPGAAATLDQAAVPCKPGQSITLGAYAEITNAGTDNGYAAVFLLWYNSSMGLISVSGGNQISGQGGSYHNTTVTGSAPAGCAFVVARLTATAPSGGTIRYDNVSWNYVSIAAPAGLIFKATQAAPGKSGSSEPAWPSTVGASVTDNQVTWEGVLATRLIWQASPLMTSGATEPAWPTQNGGAVRDGTINWTAQSSAITDVNCPHSKIVMIAASKVYAADNDIIRYCATVNPLDWTTHDDAGYIAFGLQTYGSNPVAAMNLYRSNLVPFNAEGFQMWQVDPDPANIDLLDALPIASTFNRALAPVANDLLFLSSQGVRSVGIAASSTNLQAGDVGMPIDILVQEAMSVSKANAVEPLSTYIPAAGQYWLSFANYPPGLPSISGHLPNGFVGQPASFQYVISGGLRPYGNVVISAGSLPPGLSISAAGLVTGTRTTAGTYPFTVSVTDSLSNVATDPDTSTTTTYTFGWQYATTPLIQHATDCAINGNTIVVSAYNGTITCSLDRGVTWAVQHVDANNYGVFGLEWFGAWYLGDDERNSTVLVASDDTFSFVPLANSPPTVANNVIKLRVCDGSLYFMALPEVTNSQIYKMVTPGLPWTRIDIGHAYGAVKDIVKVGTKFVMCTSTGKILTTTDMVTFTVVKDVSPDVPDRVSSGNGVIIVSSNTGLRYLSTDGGATFSASIGSPALSEILYTGNLFYGIAFDGTSVQSSPDGNTWTTVLTGTPTTSAAVCSYATYNLGCFPMFQTSSFLTVIAAVGS